jgi:hypothetical protein
VGKFTFANAFLPTERYELIGGQAALFQLRFVAYHNLILNDLSRGAGSRARTDDLLITNQLLYQLSYAGKIEPSYTTAPDP